MKKLYLGLLLCVGSYTIANNVNGLRSVIATHDVAGLEKLLKDESTTIDTTFSATLSDGFSHSGLSPISYAAYFGYAEMVEMLVAGLEKSSTLTVDEIAAIINQEDSYGWTAYLYSVRHHHDRLMAYLESKGATISSSMYNRTRLMVAAVHYHSVHGDLENWLKDDNSLLEQMNEASRHDAFGQGRNALMLAIEKNQHVVPVLLSAAFDQNNASTLLAQTDHNGRTALITAMVADTAQVIVKSKTILARLLEAYSSVELDVLNIQDAAGMTALMYAAHNNDLASVTTLLQAGADPLLVNNDKQFAFQLTNNLAIKRLLLAYVENETGIDTVIKAAQMVEDESAALAAIRVALSVKEVNGNRVINIDRHDTIGKSALLYAIDNQYMEIIKTLLSAGVDLRVRSIVTVGETVYSYITPLIYTIIVRSDCHAMPVYNSETGDLNALDEVLQLLLTVNPTGTHLSAAVNVRADDEAGEQGRTLLMYAVAYQNGPAVYHLVRNSNVNLDLFAHVSVRSVSYTHATALMYALLLDLGLQENASSDKYGIIKQLVSQRRFTQIDARVADDEVSFNPLILAVIYGMSCIRDLLKAGADQTITSSGFLGNAGSCYQATPLIIAIKKAESSVVFSGELDATVKLLLYTNYERTHAQEALNMYDSSNQHEEGNGKTALMYAIEKQNHPIVHALLEKECSLTTTSRVTIGEETFTHMTPLMYAVILNGAGDNETNGYAITQLLAIRHGQNGVTNSLNGEENSTDKTALLFAIDAGNADVVTLLLNQGASLSTRYSGTLSVLQNNYAVENVTPLQYAVLISEDALSSSYKVVNQEYVGADLDPVIYAILNNAIAHETISSWLNLREGDQEEGKGLTALHLAIMVQNGPAVYHIAQADHAITVGEGEEITHPEDGLKTKATVRFPYGASEEDQTTYYGVTPLMFAVIQDNHPALGENKNTNNYFIITVLSAYDVLFSEDNPVADALEGIYEDDVLTEGTGFNALMFAIHNHNAAATYLIANKTTNLTKTFTLDIEDTHYAGLTPLMYAVLKAEGNGTSVYAGSVEDSEAYRDADEVVYNLANCTNTSKSFSFDLMIEMAEDQEVDAPSTYSALMFAIRQVNGPVVRVLVNAGVGLTTNAQQYYLFARGEGEERVLEPLTRVYFPTMTPLMYATLLADSDYGYQGDYLANPSYQIAKHIINRMQNQEMNFNVQDLQENAPYGYIGSGWTALHFAIKNDNATLVRKMLAQGASPYWSYNNVLGNLTEDQSFEVHRRFSDVTPFIFVALCNNNTINTVDIVNALTADAHTTVEEDNIPPFFNSYLYDLINYQDMQGRTALMYACMTGAYSLINAINAFIYRNDIYDNEGYDHTEYPQYSNLNIQDAYHHTAGYYGEHVSGIFD